ncbi:MAG TPA: hypothetical protein VMM13_09190 [Euzebya sp.]|nr:hypothetical protein [Euzebya sp.]
MTYRRPLSPAVLDAIATHPGRIIGYRRMTQLGHDSTQITQWVRAGLLERLLAGWYRAVGDIVPPLQHILAAWAYLTTLQPDSPILLAGEAALSVGGLDMPIPSHPMFLVQHGRRVRLPDQPFGTIQCKSIQSTGAVPRRPDPGRLVLQQPGPAIAVALAERQRTDDELRQLVYRVMNTFRLPAAELVHAWQQLRPHQISRLMALVADGSLQHESPAERSTFLDVLSQHPPAPDCQVLLAPGIRVDYVYLFAALVLE